MIAAAERLKAQRRVPYKALSPCLKVSYSSLLRWHGRRRLGQSLVKKPGPPKVKPLDMKAFDKAVHGLSFGRVRTAGTGALYERFRDSMSRREQQLYVNEFRLELRGLQQDLERRVSWRRPGTVWSVDDTEEPLLPQARGMVDLLYDLGARFNVGVLGAERIAKGEQVAACLEEAFKTFGAPIFLKRDKGSNLNDRHVDQVLAEWYVIPLNSPTAYPPYNGSIECEQRLLKRELEARVGPAVQTPLEYRQACELAGHRLNHRRRRVLGGRTPCAALQDGLGWVRQIYNRRKRKEVFDRIEGMAVDIIRRLRDDRDMVPDIAWRYACETWMQQNSLIRVTKPKEASPHYAFFQTH
jgi:transposase InsO family protein